MRTLDFIKKIENGEAKVLTVEAAKNLKGTAIYSMYQPYHANASVVEELIVGDIVTEWEYAHTLRPNSAEFKNRAEEWADWMSKEEVKAKKETLILLNSEGVSTHIFSDNEGVFNCSDLERPVYFIKK